MGGRARFVLKGFESTRAPPPSIAPHQAMESINDQRESSLSAAAERREARRKQLEREAEEDEEEENATQEANGEDSQSTAAPTPSTEKKK